MIIRVSSSFSALILSVTFLRSCHVISSSPSSRERPTPPLPALEGRHKAAERSEGRSRLRRLTVSHRLLHSISDHHRRTLLSHLLLTNSHLSLTPAAHLLRRPHDDSAVGVTQSGRLLYHHALAEKLHSLSEKIQQLGHFRHESGELGKRGRAGTHACARTS